MKAVLVYTKSIKQAGQTFNQEIGREDVPVELVYLEATRDYVVNRQGKLFKVLEKIADLNQEEIRVLVREV